MKLFIAKVAAATAAIGAVVMLAASQLWPQLPPWKPLLIGAAAVAVLLAVLLVYFTIVGNIRQWLFRHGAIDPEWLWMPGDPAGFKRYWWPRRAGVAPQAPLPDAAQNRSSRR